MGRSNSTLETILKKSERIIQPIRQAATTTRKKWEGVQSHPTNPALELEKIIGTPAYEWLRRKRIMTPYTVDTGSTQLFSIIFGSYMDINVMKLGPVEWIGNRITSFLANSVVGRPFGKLKDWWYNLTGMTDEDPAVKRYVMDLIYMTPPNVSLYLAYTVVSATAAYFIEDKAIEPKHFLDATITALKVMPWCSPVYNYCLDIGREFMGFPTSTELAERAEIHEHYKERRVELGLEDPEQTLENQSQEEIAA